MTRWKYRAGCDCPPAQFVASGPFAFVDEALLAEYRTEWHAAKAKEDAAKKAAALRRPDPTKAKGPAAPPAEPSKAHNEKPSTMNSSNAQKLGNPVDVNATHDLDYDAGPASPDEFDIVETVVQKAVAKAQQSAAKAARIPLSCPSALRDLPAWLCWRMEPNDNPGGKARKVPLYAAGGRRVGKQGTAEDRNQLVTFDVARAAAARRGFDGVGFAPMPDWNIVALDFDGCITDGEIHPEVLALLNTTYAEISPSGRGIRAFFQGQLGNPKSHGEPFGFELFSSKGYVTYTGAVLDHVQLLGNSDTVAPVDQVVMELVQRRFKKDLEKAAEPIAQDGKPVGLSQEQIDRALAALPEDLDYDRWVQVGMALHHETQGEGFEIWDTWSQRSPKYTTREYGVERWNSFGKGGGAVVTARSLVHLANAHGAGMSLSGPASADEFELIEGGVSEATEKAKRTPVRLDWDAIPEDPPDPKFVIPGWMPDGVVTLFAAHGGTGKSFMSVYIALCLATGKHPFAPGTPIERTKVFLYSAEDDMTVMHGRFAKYMRILDINRDDLKGWLEVVDATESDNVLFTGDEKVNGRTTQRFKWLADEIALCGAQVLIFDNASDAIDANENDRAKVRQFMSSLKRLASAVLLLAHVDAVSSMADIGDAKGYSGSTAWHNSARSRWFMARAKDTDDVVLTLPKVNYAKAGAEAVIRWSDQLKVFEVVSTRQGRAKAADHRVEMLQLLRKAIDQGNTVSVATTTSTSVWNTLKHMDGFPSGLKSADMAKEVSRWRADGLVVAEEYQRANRSTGERLVLTDAGRALCDEPDAGGAEAEDFQ